LNNGEETGLLGAEAFVEDPLFEKYVPKLVGLK
jgi:hypothetical protein